MRLRPVHILLLFVMLLAGSSCSRRARVIPVSKMTDIYAGMFMTDQWILKGETDVKGGGVRVADTSIVYGQILEKYGYTVDDYHKSVCRYMQKPEKFSRIFTAINKDFLLRAEELRIAREAMEKEEERLEALKAYKRDVKPIVPLEGPFNYHRRIRAVADTATNTYKIVPVREDTVFNGPVMIIRSSHGEIDSVSVTADTLAFAIDSLATIGDIVAEESAGIGGPPVPEQPASVLPGGDLPDDVEPEEEEEPGEMEIAGTTGPAVPVMDKSKLR